MGKYTKLHDQKLSFLNFLIVSDRNYIILVFVFANGEVIWSTKINHTSFKL
jgi:hypothetical protein